MNPALYSKNYVDGTTTIYSGDALGDISNPYPMTFIRNIHDGDRSSFWESDGADSDAAMVVLTLAFASTREIDTIIITGHNFKDVAAQYFDGVDWQDFDDADDLDADSVILSVATAVNTGMIRIAVEPTQVADEEKRVAQVIACRKLVEFSGALVGYRPALDSRKEARLDLADGGERFAAVNHSPHRSAKYQASMRFDFSTPAEVALVQQLREQAQVLTWVPEPDDRLDEVYQVNIVGQFQYPYVSEVKGAGYRFQLELREA